MGICAKEKMCLVVRPCGGGISEGLAGTRRHPVNWHPILIRNGVCGANGNVAEVHRPVDHVLQRMIKYIPGDPQFPPVPVTLKKRKLVGRGRI